MIIYMNLYKLYNINKEAYQRLFCDRLNIHTLFSHPLRFNKIYSGGNLDIFEMVPENPSHKCIGHLARKTGESPNAAEYCCVGKKYLIPARAVWAWNTQGISGEKAIVWSVARDDFSQGSNRVLLESISNFFSNLWYSETSRNDGIFDVFSRSFIWNNPLNDDYSHLQIPNQERVRLRFIACA